MWGIELIRQSEISLVRQIYQKFRDQIIAGRIKGGEALPSTRELAKGLVVSRSTVCEAYEMLLTEGYVVSRQGAPTRVAEGLYIEKVIDKLPNEDYIKQRQLIKADFRTGRPDLRRFPLNTWNTIMRKTCEEISLQHLGYTGPDGLVSLRKEIAQWLFRSRGLMVNFQDIFITTGATQALHILVDLLATEGKEILIEDPCHTGMLNVLRSKGFPVCPVAVDEQGIQIDKITGTAPCAIYLTPSHQFPLGGILPANRRTFLIRFAREKGIYLIEDDYDSEFRYCGEPVAPLISMDQQRVIYVGTFSKILFPAIRIGYVILPRQLQKKWRFLRTHVDVQNPPFEQAALAEYLSSRKFDRHVNRMGRLYGKRRQLLLQLLTEAFSDQWRVIGDAAGLHLTIEFPGKTFKADFIEKSKEWGIYITTVEEHSICKGVHLDKLLLGYGHLEPDEIRRGIAVLCEFMKDNDY